jgi:DNA-binding response OmpR family regulator
MIVDDEPGVVDAVKTILETEGYDAVKAYSGRECLRKLKKEKVDLILLDILMPEMDGWEVLRKLKEQGITNFTKVSMLTAVTQIGEDIFGLQDVVSDYIRKPFSREQLLGSIRKALGVEEKPSTVGKLIKIRRRGRAVDIDLVAEEVKATAPKYALEPSLSYLVEEERAEKAFDIFKDYVQHNVPGLCITRQHLDAVREKYGLVKTPILWLSKQQGKNNLSPTDLGLLRQIIIEYLEKSGESIIILDGLEYLITHNSFEALLKYLDDINEAVMLSKSRLLIPVDPRALDEKELALLERGMKPIKVVEES